MGSEHGVHRVEKPDALRRDVHLHALRVDVEIGP
jgi:hypothetical protein